jgi:hypothetical protein
VRRLASSNSFSGISQSVQTGRWWPCCSVEPIGMATGMSARAASAISGQVISR